MNEQFSPTTVSRIIDLHLPDEKVASYTDRGVWIRRIVEIRLASGRTVFLKIRSGAEGTDPCEKEAWISDLMRANGLPAPRTLALDLSGEIIPEPFIIQERVGGTRLDLLLKTYSNGDRPAIYRALGRFFRKLHGIHGERSGWLYGAGEQLPYSPNDFMHRQVIIGQGAEAVALGLLAKDTHARMVAIFEENLPYLKSHVPTLVYNPLPWTVYLGRDANGEWAVTKTTDLHDMLYFDPAFDLSGIRYPAFGTPCDAHWDAFLSEYGEPPEEKRMKLYLMIQRLDAALGQYYAPAGVDNAAWRERAFAELQTMVDEM